LGLPYPFVGRLPIEHAAYLIGTVDHEGAATSWGYTAAAFFEFLATTAWAGLIATDLHERLDAADCRLLKCLLFASGLLVTTLSAIGARPHFADDLCSHRDLSWLFPRLDCRVIPLANFELCCHLRLGQALL
jgi:hypothetical protein